MRIFVKRGLTVLVSIVTCNTVSSKSKGDSALTRHVPDTINACVLKRMDFLSPSTSVSDNCCLTREPDMATSATGNVIVFNF
jgi:hypothetical protein